ncbi:MAG TPA: metallophosphoesterase, partial [Gemmatimonadaceae bacterium]|nr:metallophosphoesterase [Gemmatimonadaceae bacterium]
CYQPTWGRHKARTWAQLGNHEYYTGTADPTFDYFGDRAGPRGKGYYSFDLGDWHIIVLNDNRSFVPYKAGSEQEQWLLADLAANTKQCTIAVWHEPYYYSSNTSTTRYTGIKVLVDHLYAAGVEILLTGHRHLYERFAPQDPMANRDDARGIREFIVGTGGRGYSTVSTIAPNSEVRGIKVYGVLELTLHADRYDWRFVSIAGQSFTDAGSGTCH